MVVWQNRRKPEKHEAEHRTKNPEKEAAKDRSVIRKDGDDCERNNSKIFTVMIPRKHKSPKHRTYSLSSDECKIKKDKKKEKNRE
jgi:hypothetical protein